MLSLAFCGFLAIAIIAFWIINRYEHRAIQRQLAVRLPTYTVSNSAPTVTSAGNYAVVGGGGGIPTFTITPPVPPKVEHVQCASCERSIPKTEASTVGMELPLTDETVLPLTVYLCDRCVDA